MTRPQIFTFISDQKLSWILQLTTCVCWVSSYIYPNEHHMHFLETSLSRAIISLIGNYVIMIYKGGSLDLTDPKTYRFANWRSLTNTFHGMLIALLMFYLPMPIIHTISSSSSIFTAAIEHYYFSIHISKFSKYLIIVSILGVMLQANGEYISHLIWGGDGQGRHSKFLYYQNISGMESLGISLGFLGWVVVWSYGLVIVKQIKMAYYQLNLHNNIVLIIVTGLAYCLIPQSQKSPLKTLTLSLIFSGTLVFIAQITFVLSLMICKSVGLMMVLNTANILIAYAYSLIRYQESVDLVSMVGVVVTLGCIFLVISDRYR